MIDILVVICTVLLTVAVVLLILILIRTSKSDSHAELKTILSSLREDSDRVERSIREEIARNRDESGLNAKHLREEISDAMRGSGEIIGDRLVEMGNLQKNQLDSFSKQLSDLTQANEQRFDKLRETVEAKLRTMQDDNSLKLEQMRATVDEKLHSTLEKRLGESFRMVSERLELVHKGLGEMQTLASGVGDLKKVLTNIKTRGTWGEIQLGNLLEQILTPDQYGKNIAPKQGSGERVEFAIKLPGPDKGSDEPVWLPIDAKFPQEDYQLLLEAQDQANLAMVEEAGKRLENRIKGEAKSIREKYLDPPRTTDFGIMFLPTEGLYAEVIRRTGLIELLQREYRVVVAGPNTIAAFLNSLQMGFRTLVIEKRSSEVWSLLGAVKTEFGRFGEILEKTKKKLDEASNTIDSAAVRTRAIERKLKNVQELPAADASHLLGSGIEIDDDEE